MVGSNRSASSIPNSDISCAKNPVTVMATIPRGAIQLMSARSFVVNDEPSKEVCTETGRTMNKIPRIDKRSGQSKMASKLSRVKLAVRMINTVETSNIQYYIIQNDPLGQSLIRLLTEKAKQGVRIRLLYDAVESRGLRHKHFKDLLTHGGEVKSFFPSKLGINFRVNNRNHRKLSIIDGDLGYIGGFNVGDEYLGKDEHFGYWRDVHLRISGDAVKELLERFILDWNRSVPTKTKSRKNDFVWPTEGISHHASPVQIVTSGPNSSTEHLKNMLVKMITQSKGCIYIQTPYFIPDASFLDACRIALMAGTKIKLMITNKPDHMFVYWTTYANAAELVRYGAEVFTYEEGFLHAKTLVINGEVASIGTTNIDARSFRLNFEISALVFDRDVAQPVIDAFERDESRAERLTIERYESRTR